MPIGKEIKKFTKKFPREVGRIVKQAGQAVQDATDIQSIIQIGEDIEKEGLRMMERTKNKLIETNNCAQLIGLPFSADVNTNIIQQQHDISDHSQDAKITYMVNEKHGSIEDLDEQLELISLSSSEAASTRSSILVQKNLELMKKVEELEAELNSIKQNTENNSGTNTSDNINKGREQKNSIKNNHEGHLRLVLRLNQIKIIDSVAKTVSVR